MYRVARGVLITSLFLAYPFLIYKGIDTGQAWIAPLLFGGIYLLRAINTPNAKVGFFKGVFAISLLLGAYYLETLTAKILPVLIQLALMHFFGRTLMKGNGPPLIERFVRLDFPQFPSGVSEYCRQLTTVWAVFFGFNVLMCTGLSLWGTNYWWALYNGLLVYVLIGTLFVGEYIYRHFRFPNLDISDPISSLRSIIVNGRQIWLDVESN